MFMIVDKPGVFLPITPKGDKNTKKWVNKESLQCQHVSNIQSSSSSELCIDVYMAGREMSEQE